MPCLRVQRPRWPLSGLCSGLAPPVPPSRSIHRLLPPNSRANSRDDEHRCIAAPNHRTILDLPPANLRLFSFLYLFRLASLNHRSLPRTRTLLPRNKHFGTCLIRHRDYCKVAVKFLWLNVNATAVGTYYVDTDEERMAEDSKEAE